MQGLAAKNIICKEFANSHSTTRKIYNELGTARVEELRGRRLIEAMVELISCTSYNVFDFGLGKLLGQLKLAKKMGT